MTTGHKDEKLTSTLEDKKTENTKRERGKRSVKGCIQRGKQKFTMKQVSPIVLSRDVICRPKKFKFIPQAVSKSGCYLCFMYLDGPIENLSPNV